MQRILRGPKKCLQCWFVSVKRARDQVESTKDNLSLANCYFAHNSSGFPVVNAVSYTYDSFGNLAASTGSLTNPCSHTGRE
jgi:hypothetical protein